MEKILDTYHPEGFHTLNAYLFAQSPFLLIDFLKKAFYAKELNRTLNPRNGELTNCIMQIGDSCFMISQARGKFSNMFTSFYFYVDDVDDMYKRALASGAKSEFEPADMEYGDRQAGVIDPCGNYWWISKRLKEEDYN